MLANVVTDYLEKRISDKMERVEIKEGNSLFLRIVAEASDFGDIELYDDGDEVTIIFGRFTHSHYNNYDDIPQEEKELRIAEDVFEALDATLNDRYEFWGAHEGPGGFRDVEYVNKQNQGIVSRVFGRGSLKTFYRWSGAARQIKC